MSVANEIRKRVHKRVQLTALGNSTRSMRDVAVDLINESKQDWSDIAEGTYLSKSTIKKLATDQTRFPRIDTLERIFTYFSCSVTFNEANITPKYDNRPKPKTGRKKR